MVSPYDVQTSLIVGSLVKLIVDSAGLLDDLD